MSVSFRGAVSGMPRARDVVEGVRLPWWAIGDGPVWASCRSLQLAGP
ncbi:hypothetical protein ACFT5D_33025 [Streptomyces sp. NPDC057144]